MSEEIKPDYEKVAFPGKLKVSGEIRGHYAGCKMLEFSSADEVNAWAETAGAVTIVPPSPMIRDGKILIIYTCTLEPQQLAYLEQVARKTDEFMEEFLAKAKANAAEAEAERLKAREEEKRLAELGKKCKSHHGSLAKQLRQLKRGKLSQEEAEKLVESLPPEEEEALAAEEKKDEPAGS